MALELYMYYKIRVWYEYCKCIIKVRLCNIKVKYGMSMALNGRFEVKWHWMRD